MGKKKAAAVITMRNDMEEKMEGAEATGLRVWAMGL